jgi:hypothetical protein
MSLHYGDATVIGNTGKNGSQNECQPGKAEASLSASMESNKDLLARLEARTETNRGLITK